MDEIEEPPASRAIIVRTTQACQRCRSLKTRCLPGSHAGVCHRCSASGKECIWAEQPRRARKLRAPSRISQVEQKIDGLVAKLVNAPVTAPKDDSAISPSTVTPATRPPGVGGVGCWSETWRKQGTVAPGSWLPIPNSFEHSSGQLEAVSEQTPDQTATQETREAEVDRQYIEQIRTIHSFGDAEDLHQAPEGLFLPSKRREVPIEHELVQRILATQEADSLLNVYRQMSSSFPFVIVPPNVTAQELHREKPMLLLAILTAASSQEHQRQMSLDTIYRQELAQRTIISPRRTLGLVQSVLVYLSWYHFVFSHKTQQIFFLHHLVIGLALDIGLHKDYQPLNFPHRPKPAPPSPQDRRERERAFLGCYYLSSMIGAGLQKPNLLKHTSYMTEWAQNLKNDREYASDETISHLIILRQLDDQVQDTLYSAAAIGLPLSDTRTLMHVRFLENQLDAWKRESQSAGAQRRELAQNTDVLDLLADTALVLSLSSSFTDMLLHSVALRAPTSEDSLPSVDSTQLNALLSTLEAGKRFLDALLSFPVDEYHLISFSEWMRLPTVIMTVARLCMPTDAHVAIGWDFQTAQERVRLDLCLESLCYRMQQLSTYDKSKQSHPDFWYAMRFINDLTKNWYMRKIKSSTSSQFTPSGGTGVTGSERSGPSAGAFPTPSSNSSLPNFGMDMGMGDYDVHMGGHDDRDPFAFMKDMDFDMEQFFDMGIWGDEGYNGMGFGGGMP